MSFGVRARHRDSADDFRGRVRRAGLRGFLARAEALGFESAWVVEQILGLDRESRAGHAAHLRRRVHRADPARLRRSADRARSPVHLAKSLGDARSPERRADRRRRRARRQPEDLPGVRAFRGPARRPVRRGPSADEAALDRGARDLRRRVLQARERLDGAQASAEAAPAALVRRPPSERAPARRGAGRRVHRRRLRLDRRSFSTR